MSEASRAHDHAPRTVLVTGAMGQVGARLTTLLLERNQRVVAVDLDTEHGRTTAVLLAPGRGQPGDLVPTFADITDADAVQALVRRETPDAIIHLAAVVSPSCYRDPEFARRVNVDGTANLVAAACELRSPPDFVLASSSAVYGSRNPYRRLGRIGPETPTDPVDCYGWHKVAAERIVRDSGLRFTILRIGGIVSPEALARSDADYLVLMRATPRDNRVHMVDARDVALAFANAVDRIESSTGQVLLIGGDESCVHTHTSVQDDILEAIGLGRLGPSINLPGNPDDDLGWGLTDWFDTAGSQELLEVQQHTWTETLDWLARSQGRRRTIMRTVAPIMRTAARGLFAAQRRKERRGPYADPWRLIQAIYGPDVLAHHASWERSRPSRRSERSAEPA
jgi:nucleoside-diphosphate-sugar epimerase